VRLFALLALLAGTSLAGCAGSAAAPPPPLNAIPPGRAVAVAPLVYDALEGGPCALSADGLLWYRVRAPQFAPIRAAFASCDASAVLRVDLNPALPAWSRPSGPTQAIFVAASMAQGLNAGPAALESIAAAHEIPVTWLISDRAYLDRAPVAALFDRYHAANGDDVQTTLGYVPLARVFSWYEPVVALLGAGRERDIQGVLNWGERAFWGITWNSHGVDGTWDEGAPWGTYCADVTSYKRPDPNGNCGMVSFEWTARDLTRAYFTGREDAYSSDPDDLVQRAHFTPSAAAAYARLLVDAYAAAGQAAPLVFVSHQECEEQAKFAPTDTGTLDAIYDEANRTGMRVLTMSQALPLAAAFSDRPRAVAFPFIPGNPAYLPEPVLPATIDYHDRVAGMTFESGRALPLRIFEYADAPRSLFNVPLPQVGAAEMPRLTSAAVEAGRLYLHFEASRALHAGIAIWGDPQALGISGAGVVAAGHAGAVAVFDLPQGPSDQSVACAACSSTAFDYPL
jgi:hypothetical protein